MRTFLAIEVPEYVRKVIYDFAQGEAKKELPIKWVAFENLHITLKFLGEIDEKRKSTITSSIAEIAEKHKPFRIQLDGVGCFPNTRNPRVLWIGVQEGSKNICGIAADLEKDLTQFGFETEKQFHPHLTFGRIKQWCSVEDILAGNIVTESFEVGSIVLFKSTLKPGGPIYEELGKFALD